jgi:hypothetical protein
MRRWAQVARFWGSLGWQLGEPNYAERVSATGCARKRNRSSFLLSDGRFGRRADPNNLLGRVQVVARQSEVLGVGAAAFAD